MSDPLPSASAGWPAEYNDGKTAAGHQAHARIEAEYLVILDPQSQALAAWPLGEVRLIERSTGNARLRLGRAETDERLTVLSAPALETLKACCPYLHRDAYGGPSWRAVTLWTGAAVATVAFLFFVAVPFVARQATHWVPARFEAELGRRTADAIIQIVGRRRQGRSSAECVDPQGRAALDRLTAPLMAAARLRQPVTIRAVDSPIVNAIALPGGQILVFGGLIDFVQSPNELAGVLAHETAHIELGHPTTVAIERGASAFIVGLLFGDVLGGSAVAGIGQAALQARFSQEAESAADARGVAILEAAGLDPRPFGSFFQRLAEKERGAPQMMAFLQSHPPSEKRAALIQAAPESGREALNAADWLALKRICL